MNKFTLSTTAVLSALLLAACNSGGSNSGSDNSVNSSVYSGVTSDASGLPLLVKVIATDTPVLAIWDDRNHLQTYGGQADQDVFSFSGAGVECTQNAGQLNCETDLGQMLLTQNSESSQAVANYAGEYHSSWDGQTSSLVIESSGKVTLTSASCTDLGQLTIEQGAAILSMKEGDCGLAGSVAYASYALENDQLASIELLTGNENLPNIWVSL